MFEDLVLNQEFGEGFNFEDILTGPNSIRFDSSQAFIRLDGNLFARQEAAADGTKYSFLYPQMKSWNKSYNTIQNKIHITHRSF